MGSEIKSLQDIEVLMEKAYDELMHLDGFLALDDKQKESLMSAQRMLFKETMKLPLAKSDIERENIETNIKMCKGIFFDVFAADMRGDIDAAKNVGLEVIKSVLVAAIKTALPL